ncbi:MAG: hypothetical protein HY920_04635 [Elusimicrobia bacterium]|nr:hypothetical protein [Elusimicrobiota bacterium]
MSAPRKACNIQLVKIQPDERPAITSEQTFAPDEATYRCEARGEGYRATTQVKGLSPEITIVSEAEVFHLTEGSILISANRQGDKNLAGSETVALYQKDTIGTWENQYIPIWVCNHKPINGEDLQMIYWWSDKSIVAMKSRNRDGAKGLTRRPMEGDTTARRRTGQQLSTKPKTMTYTNVCKKVFLKSRVREICKHGSVRGFMVSSNYRRWL